MCNMLYMNLFLLSRIFNKKLIKGFPPCTACPNPNSDCGQPCGCGGGQNGGCGSGGGSGGGGGPGPKGGGNGPSPRLFQAYAAPGGDVEEVSAEALEDADFAENVSDEIEEFLAVGQMMPGQVGTGDPFYGGGYGGPVKPSDMFGGGGCSDGCGGGCGGGNGFGGGFGGGNPYGSYTQGNFSVNVSLFGNQSNNGAMNMIGITCIY